MENVVSDLVTNRFGDMESGAFGYIEVCSVGGDCSKGAFWLRLTTDSGRHSLQENYDVLGPTAQDDLVLRSEELLFAHLPGLSLWEGVHGDATKLSREGQRAQVKRGSTACSVDRDTAAPLAAMEKPRLGRAIGKIGVSGAVVLDEHRCARAAVLRLLHYGEN
ncbi:hypothetical protein H920_03395 [Fukomys damarensis]|uniref:Uncharacterized protein n=1 Tax=Fukomys damarensis TaxID=885580 RepID=A0A091DYB5_FUKDA|nr:hypothetical protein H920_03395 [Fukomys damarensis]